jgi:hypothetical protein
MNNREEESRSITEDLKKIFEHSCHEKLPLLNLIGYIYNNEICGAVSLDIGSDSTDGRTWVNE